jgi:WD40 repeat protein
MRLRILVLVLLPVLHGADLHPNYDDDIKPIFRRYCFQCHSASEARSGLNLEAYTGVLRGGSSGEAVAPGRASTSLLYQAIAQEKDGVPRMPQGGAKLPDPTIATIREWIQLGAPENAASVPKVQTGPSLTNYKPVLLNKPALPVMPGPLPALPPTKATVHSHPVTALATSPWAPLASVGGHERITLYNTATRAAMGELAFPEGVPFVLRFSRDGAKLLAGGGRPVQSGKVVLYDVATGARVGVFGDEHDVVLAADLSADGKLVALGGPGKVVKVYNTSDGSLAYTISKHTDWITAIEFSPDGSKLATGDRSAGLHLWEAATGRIFVSLAEHKDSITSLSWRSDGALLASGSEDGTLVIWNAADGFPAATVANAHAAKPAPGTYGKPASGILSLAFSSDGSIATVGRDQIVKQWNADGKPKSASPARDALPTRVAVTFDGKLVLIGDERGGLTLWDGKQATALRQP